MSHAAEGDGATLTFGSEKKRCCESVSVVVPASHDVFTLTSGSPGWRMNDEITSATGFDDARSIPPVKSSADVVLYAFAAMYAFTPARNASSPMYDSAMRSTHAVLP